MDLSSDFGERTINELQERRPSDESTTPQEQR